MLIFPFPVCMYAAIYYKNGRRLILPFFIIDCGIRPTGYGIINMRTNFLVYVSFIKWPPKGKDFLTLFKLNNNCQIRREVGPHINYSISCLYVCRTVLFKWKTTNTHHLPFYNKLRHMHKQEMELSTCGPTSCSLCQFITDLHTVRTYFYLFIFYLFIYLINS